MKELSIEEKAKRYDNIIEKANRMHSENCEACQACIEELIPELKESEDEKIRKEIINYIKVSKPYYKEFEDYSSWIAGLEKQGEKDEEILTLKDQIESLHAAIKAIKETHKIELEKQGEQKPVDPTFEIKPKFKVGDTIKELETGILFYVNSIEDFGYTLHYKNCNANGCTMSFKYEDKYELVEQKSAWSEEDERNISKIIEILYYTEKTSSIEPISLYSKEIKWLKSLKDRYTWKPSDAQMASITCAVRNMKESACYDSELVSLLADLKKLKE